MITFPNAKINLGLYVERRRPDNYHDISTVFFRLPQHERQTINWCLKDRVSFRPLVSEWRNRSL